MPSTLTQLFPSVSTKLMLLCLVRPVRLVNGNHQIVWNTVLYAQKAFYEVFYANWSLWTFTKTALSDKVSSKSVLEKAGLRPLNEMVASQTALMVWKSKKANDPLGRNLFPIRSIRRQTRSINSTNATQPVPGNSTLAANLMARAWNSSTELHTVTTVGAAKVIARKWAQNLLVQ